MSFLGIVTLVLVALIILSLLFVFFKAFILLLPVALIAIGVMWLVLWISGKRNKNRVPASGTYFDWFKASEPEPNNTRKRARNVTIKDIDDDK